MIKKLLKPHIILLAFLLFMVFCIVPSNELLAFLLLGTCLYFVTVFFFSSKLKEANLTVIISILVSSFIFICIFLFFKVNPDAYTNDQATYNTLGKTIYNYFEYGVVPKPSPEPIKLLGIKIGERNLEPTAYRPVGYPLFIAFVYLVTRSTNYIWVLISQYALHLLSLYIFFGISKKVLGEKLTIISVILYSLNTPLLFVSNSMLSEGLAQFLLLFGIYLTLISLQKNNKITFSIASGLVFGFLILVRPIFLIYIPILFAPGVYVFTKTHKFDLKFSISGFTTTAVFLLWIIRNSLLAGSLTSIATNGGINMFLGNNDSIFNGRATTWPEGEINDLMGSVELINDTRVGVETSRDKVFKKNAQEWIVDHPVLFTRFAIDKLQHLLLPHKGLFDSIEHLNNPRIDKFFLIIFFQSLGFWLLLLLTSIGMFSKKSLLILGYSLPYIGMVFLSFATTRFQIPLYIPAALIGAVGIENLRLFKNTKKFVFFIGLTIFIIHFLKWKETLFETFRDYKFRSKIIMASNLNLGPSTLIIADTDQENSNKRFITKIYDETKYIKATLFFEGNSLDFSSLEELLKEYRIVSYNLDVFDYLDTEFINNFLLVYAGNTYEEPYFEIISKKDLNIKTEESLASDLFSGQKDLPKLVYMGTVNSSARYIYLNVSLTKGSSIKISGVEDVILKIRPRIKNTFDTDVLIPQKYLYQGYKIYISNNSVVNDPDNISMFRDNRYMWAPTQVRINQLSVIY